MPLHLLLLCRIIEKRLYPAVLQVVMKLFQYRKVIEPENPLRAGIQSQIVYLIVMVRPI